MVARSWDPACQYVKLAADGQRPTQKFKALRVTRGSFQGTRKAQSSSRRPRGNACNLVGSGGPCRREVRDQRIDLLGPVSWYSLCAAGDSARSRMKHTYTPFREAKPGQSGNPARTLNPNVYKTTITARGVQYHTWNQGARAIREPGKNPARSHFNLCLAQGSRPRRLPIFLVERGAGIGCRRGALGVVGSCKTYPLLLTSSTSTRV